MKRFLAQILSAVTCKLRPVSTSYHTLIRQFDLLFKTNNTLTDMIDRSREHLQMLLLSPWLYSKLPLIVNKRLNESSPTL